MRPAIQLGLLTAAAAGFQPLPLMTRPALATMVTRMLSSEDLSKCTVVELKARLKAAGLPVSGRKAELIDRLGGGVPAVAAPVGVVAAAVTSAFPLVEIEACKS